MARKARELSAKELRLHVDPKEVEVSFTKELCPVKHGVVGQERAIEAIKFGVGMNDPEYNIYVAGTTDTGATYMARALLEEDVHFWKRKLPDRRHHRTGVMCTTSRNMTNREPSNCPPAEAKSSEGPWTS